MPFRASRNGTGTGSGRAAGRWDDGMQVGERLALDHVGLHRIDEGEDVVIEHRIEPRPAPGATSTLRDADQLAWARRRPAECIWRLRREEAERAGLQTVMTTFPRAWPASRYAKASGVSSSA
jgi:hypothetical protein